MGRRIFLLLIACAKRLQTFFGARSLRERESAIRPAIGASRWILARQIPCRGALLGLDWRLGRSRHRVARDARIALHRSRESFAASIPFESIHRVWSHRNLKPPWPLSSLGWRLPGAQLVQDVIDRAGSRQPAAAKVSRRWPSRERSWSVSKSLSPMC